MKKLRPRQHRPAQDPAVAEAVRNVDLTRYRFICSLFAEMGFEGVDLEDRAWVWLVFESAQHTVYAPGPPATDDDAVTRRHAFFTWSRIAG